MGTRNGGRSLLELMVTLGVLALAASALPNLGRLRDWACADGVGREVASALSLAQGLACSQGERVGVMFLRRPDRWLIWRDDDHDRMPDDEEILKGPVRLPDGVEFGARSGMDPITFVGDRVVFLPTRGVNGLPGSVYVHRGSFYARITVLTNGRIRHHPPHP